VSRVIELSDEHYRTIERVAAARRQSPASLLANLIESLATSEVGGSPSYETGDWFRHLGATEEQIGEAERVVQARRRTPDADP
jgi:hypothetical protein